MSQAASDLNLSIVVEEGQSRRIIQALHELLVQPAKAGCRLRSDLGGIAGDDARRGGVAGALVGAQAGRADTPGPGAFLGLRV